MTKARKKEIKKAYGKPKLENSDQYRWQDKDQEPNRLSCGAFMKLSKHMMFQKRERTQQYENLLWALHTRAWLSDIPVTLIRIAYKAMSLGLYYKPECIIGHK